MHKVGIAPDGGFAAMDRVHRRVAVIGDVGGHLDELRRELRRLGAAERTGRLPPDLTVIQVGDLVHRGPASAAVVALVDGYLGDQPGQWIQLVGNHEAQYLRQRAFDWPEQIDPGTVDTLRRWWADGQMLAAVSVASDEESFLVTHAGLTVDFWRRTLSAPGTAEETATALNSMIGTHEDVLFRPGEMLGRRRPDRAVGPIWAAPATELVPGWLQSTLPFSQIHGHASLYDWQQRRFRAGPEIAGLTTVDEEAKHETVSLTGGRIIGVDPGHGEEAQRSWRSWELTGADEGA